MDLINCNEGFKLKRGDTLRVVCAAEDDDGNPCDLSQRELTAMLREKYSGERIEPFEIEIDPVKVGVFYIVGSYAATANYPLGNAEFDFQETLDGVRTSSEIMTLTIKRDVTHD